VNKFGDKEPFTTWWARNEDQVGHLHPQLAEQWVYRHWADTEFSFLPLDSLTWELHEMAGAEILLRIRREIAKRLDPEFDYEQLQGLGGFGKAQTAEELDEGTWAYPIVALSTPTGWVTRDLMHPHGLIELPNERLMLLEGHQRHRYLNALHRRRRARIKSSSLHRRVCYDCCKSGCSKPSLP
jgi:hypothetical protein